MSGLNQGRDRRLPSLNAPGYQVSSSRRRPRKDSRFNIGCIVLNGSLLSLHRASKSSDIFNSSQFDGSIQSASRKGERQPKVRALLPSDKSLINPALSQKMKSTSASRAAFARLNETLPSLSTSTGGITFQRTREMDPADEVNVLRTILLR